MESGVAKRWSIPWYQELEMLESLESAECEEETLEVDEDPSVVLEEHREAATEIATGMREQNLKAESQDMVRI